MWGAEIRSTADLQGDRAPAHSRSLRLHDTVRPDEHDSCATSARSPDVVSDLGSSLVHTLAPHTCPPDVRATTLNVWLRVNHRRARRLRSTRAGRRLAATVAGRRLLLSVARTPSTGTSRSATHSRPGAVVAPRSRARFPCKTVVTGFWHPTPETPDTATRRTSRDPRSPQPETAATLVMAPFRGRTRECSQCVLGAAVRTDPDSPTARRKWPDDHLSVGKGQDPANRGNRSYLLAGKSADRLVDRPCQGCVGRRREASRCVARTKYVSGMCPRVLETDNNKVPIYRYFR